jgi:hypothetical protein
VDQLTAVVADEEEDVQDPVDNGADDQEIGCPDALELILEVGPPALAPARVGFRHRLLTTIPKVA